MYVGAERMVLRSGSKEKVQHKKKSECHYKLFWNRVMQNELKDEEHRVRIYPNREHRAQIIWFI